MSKSMRTYLTVLAAALMPIVATGCGNVTVGGFSEASVAVTGDADTLSAAAFAPERTTAIMPAAVTAAGAADGPAASPEEAEGEVQVEFLAYLVTESGATVQLGDEEIQVKVDLRGRTEVDVIDGQLIPARRYTEFRVVFTDIHAEVDGLVIDGVPVTEVNVELEDLSLLVVRPLDLDATPGTVAELVIDLNSLAWLGAVDPVTGTVDEAVFAALVNVVTR